MRRIRPVHRQGPRVCTITSNSSGSRSTRSPHSMGGLSRGANSRNSPARVNRIDVRLAISATYLWIKDAFPSSLRRGIVNALFALFRRILKRHAFSQFIIGPLDHFVSGL